jgi:hypothetical protein
MKHEGDKANASRRRQPVATEVKKKNARSKRPVPKPSSLKLGERAYITAGLSALALPHMTFEAWVTVGKAIQILRARATRIGTREAFGRLLDQHGFKLDKAMCSRLLWIVGNLGEVAAWHASLEPAQQMAWVHPNTVFKHFKKPKMQNAKQSLTPLEAFEVMERTPPQEFLAAFKNDEVRQRVIDWLNELARAGKPAALSRGKFGSAEGGRRLHSGAMAPVGRRDDAEATKPAFAPAGIKRLRTILKSVRDRFSFEFTMEQWAYLVKWDRQELADLTQDMKRGPGRPPDETGRFAGLLLAVIYEEYTGKLPGRSNQLVNTDTDDVRASAKGSRFYKFRRAACDAIGIDVSDAALEEAIAEIKSRGKLKANFLALRIELWGGLQMATADYEQIGIHFSMALDAVAEGKLLSDVLSPGPPVQITVESALIDAAAHLKEPLANAQTDLVATFILRVLRSRRIKIDLTDWERTMRTELSGRKGRLR